ncbi:hypothetical protein Arnit_2228 [Arcobacter nitrofigilis DSM 7299]|uniref:Uncharacterized protein n=1 Tax=Arcobacter nitrofigilis (strain ATCC 33309 / DSM 7299 / CCUG 15893 / LMG 7604 / NCTC 12251 / CI) TaxID=572480 RepID=D5V0R8_ARCNC|nr:DUF5677 domain-containing protein [Arcobacter nitrofigilis]ADG93880.1 hypothetical protein Arnit_2228 [Arcobacter nitrofigilis DSM 7299]
MNIEKVHKLAEIFDKKICVYKEACDFILKSNAKHSEELFLLLLSISDSLSTLSILSKINKMRDCYAISRMIYETTINVLYIAATNFDAMDDMIKYTDEKSKYEAKRSITIDKESVFITFDGENHSVGFAKNNPFKMKGDPRDWTQKENGKSINIENRIEIINKKYGDTVSRFLQLSHLTIYRTSSDIIHGTLYGARHMLGIVNKKNNKFSVEGMIQHGYETIITLMLSISQCVYSILFAFSKEIDGVDEFEKKYSILLEEYLKVGQEK